MSGRDITEVLWGFFPVSGRIDHMEIKQSLSDLGLDISKEEAEKILQR